MENKKSEIRYKRWLEVIIMLLVIAGLMLNPDWLIDNFFEPFMFVSVIVILVKIVKREK